VYPENFQNLGRERTIRCEVTVPGTRNMERHLPMSIELEELRRLPIAEKLRIVELLWDDIAAAEEPFTLHPWHLEEAMRRAAELEANPEIALSRDELWKRVSSCFAR
jgi:putative addiction module component (TIGR02574 family)